MPEIRLHLADEVTPLWRMTQDQLDDAGAPPPFWAFAWAGGQALARWLLDHPEEAAGRTVLDFASGAGLVAVAAALAGARSVLAADIDPFAAAAVAMNAEANGVAITFVGDDLLERNPPEVELICAGDVCYEGPMAARVLDWLGRARRRGARVLIGDPHRAYCPREGLIRLADYEVPTSVELEDVPLKPASVWALP